MGSPTSLPGSNEIFRIWSNVATALATNDVQALEKAAQDISSLAQPDKSLLEQLASLLPPPWLTPQLLIQVFAEPETSIGAISRLSGQDAATIEKFFGVVESSIVLSAVTSWMKSQNVDAQNAAKAINPVDAALKAFIQSNQGTVAGGAVIAGSAVAGGTVAGGAVIAGSAAIAGSPVVAGGESSTATGVVASTSTSSNTQAVNTVAMNMPTMSTPTTNTSTVSTPVTNTSGTVTGGQVQMPSVDSLQELKNNPTLLAMLNTADPTLLSQAFQIAEAQIMISCLNKLITTQTVMAQLQKQEDEKQAEQKKEAIRVAPGQNLMQNYLTDIRDGKLPVTQSTMMVMQSMLANAAALQVAGLPPVPTVHSAAETIAATTTAAATEATGLVAVQDVVKSWDNASSAIMPSNQISTSPDLMTQLGLMAGIYSQMAPYWSVPAAVSLLRQSGPVVTEKAISEAAVRAYAIALGTLVSSPDFTMLLQNLITKNVKNPQALTEDQMTAYVAALKITLLVSALVAMRIMIARKTGGQFSTQELADLILGKLPLPTSDDLETGLIRTIQEELKNIPADNREAFINQLLATYSAKTDVESLVDPSKQFLRLLDQGFFQEQAVAENA